MQKEQNVPQILPCHHLRFHPHHHYGKNVEYLHSHPSTKNSDHLEEQLSKACAAVCTTAWRGQHGYLLLGLSYSALNRATNGVVTRIDLILVDKINNEINDHATTFEQLGLKYDQDALWIEWWTKSACLNVGTEIIVASVGAQYLEDLEEDFKGY